MFYVPMGTRAKYRTKNIPWRNFFTRRGLKFEYKERVDSGRKGFLSFARENEDGKEFVLEVPTNAVKLNKDIKEAVMECIGILAELNVEGEDDKIICDLADQDQLTTAQTILGAWLIKRYKNLLNSRFTDTAIAIVGGSDNIPF